MTKGMHLRMHKLSVLKKYPLPDSFELLSKYYPIQFYIEVSASGADSQVALSQRTEKKIQFFKLDKPNFRNVCYRKTIIRSINNLKTFLNSIASGEMLLLSNYATPDYVSLQTEYNVFWNEAIRVAKKYSLKLNEQYFSGQNDLKTLPVLDKTNESWLHLNKNRNVPHALPTSSQSGTLKNINEYPEDANGSKSPHGHFQQYDHDYLYPVLNKKQNPLNPHLPLNLETSLPSIPSSTIFDKSHAHKTLNDGRRSFVNEDPQFGANYCLFPSSRTFYIMEKGKTISYHILSNSGCRYAGAAGVDEINHPVVPWPSHHVPVKSTANYHQTGRESIDVLEEDAARYRSKSHRLVGAYGMIPL